MSVRRWVIAVALIAVGFASVARGQSIEAVSSGEHAWVAVLDDSGERPFKRLYHIPSGVGDALGVSYPTRKILPSRARLLCAVGERVVYTLAPESEESPIRVREIAATRIEGPRPYIYEDPAALSHIPQGLEVFDGLGHAGDPWVLARASGSTELRLWRLTPEGWDEGIGFAWREGERYRMVQAGDSIGVVRLRKGSSSLWIRESDENAIGFSQRPIGPGVDVAQASSVGGRLILAIEAGDTLSVHLILGGSEARRVLLGSVPSDALVVDMGGHVGGLWRDEAGTLSGRVVSLSGIQLYDGTLGPGAILRPGELQVLGLILASFLLTILFFIWRPFESGVGVVAFPEGAALADPSRRLTAWVIDMTVSVLLASSIWRVSPFEVALIEPAMSAGVFPTLTAIGIFILHTSIAEASTGRSLGKALARCRVVDRTGGHPPFVRSLLRSFIRGMCPALGTSLLMGPALREPWACGTYVVMAREEEDGADGTGDESEKKTGEGPSD